MNLLYLRFWLDNLVEFTDRSPIVDSDRQTNEREGQNYKKKKGKKNEKWLFRKIIVLLKWNLITEILSISSFNFNNKIFKYHFNNINSILKLFFSSLQWSLSQKFPLYT